jgi:hypothetical protein
VHQDYPAKRPVNLVPQAHRYFTSCGGPDDLLKVPPQLELQSPIGGYRFGPCAPYKEALKEGWGLISRSQFKIGKRDRGANRITPSLLQH